MVKNLLKKIEDDWEDDDDDTFYSEPSRVLLVEDDELSPSEAAFMRGWEEAG